MVVAPSRASIKTGRSGEAASPPIDPIAVARAQREGVLALLAAMPPKAQADLVAFAHLAETPEAVQSLFAVDTDGSLMLYLSIRPERA